MTNSSYILADDLSGALETGAAFRSRGWRVTLPLDPTAIGDGGAGEIQVVSTETRAASPARAAAVVREIVTARAAAGSRLLFKKIDSTLRGPIGAEIAAIVDALEPPFVVVCPANPAARRVVRGGILFVDGQPLAETEFKNDPQWPATGSRVGDRIEAHGLPRPCHIALESLRGGRSGASLFAATASGGRIATVDAETEDELERIVASVRETGPNALLVGSGALGAALAKQMADGGQPPSDVRHGECRRVLILCGSAHPRSHEQLDHLAGRCNVAVIPFVAGEGEETRLSSDIAAAMDSRGVAAVRFSTARGSFGDAAADLQAAIGAVARSLVDRLSPDLMVLTGGETAWTVCRAVGGSRLEVITEFQPGVVLSRLDMMASDSVLVVTKPGGFGSKDCLYAILPDDVK